MTGLSSVRPCNACGATDRYADGRCRACRHERHRKTYPANAERQRAATRAWYAANTERAAERNRRWREENPERRRELHQQWRENNPEKARVLYGTEAIRRWRATNPDKAREKGRKDVRAYRLAHPGKHREIEARRRARRNAASPKWLKASGQISEMRSFYASAKAAGFHVDHDIPLAGCRCCGAIGLHVLANLQALDQSINAAKGNRCMDCFTAAATPTILEDIAA